MSDGEIHFYNGSGTFLNAQADTNANHNSWVKFLNKNRIVWTVGNSTFGSNVYVSSRISLENTLSKWWSGSGSSYSQMESPLTVGSGEQFGALPTFRDGSDWDAKVAENDASVTGTLAFDNLANVMSIHYSDGLYRINAWDSLGGSNVETFMYVFQPDGTAVRDYSLNTKLSASITASSVHQLGLPSGTIVTYSSSGLKAAKLNSSDNVVWTASVSAAYLFACSDGNFFVTDPGSAHPDRFYKHSSVDGSLLGTYDLLDVPKSSGSRQYRPTFVSDPVNADNVYFLGGSADELIKQKLSTGALIWTEPFTGFAPGAIDAIAV